MAKGKRFAEAQVCPLFGEHKWQPAEGMGKYICECGKEGYLGRLKRWGKITILAYVDKPRRREITQRLGTGGRRPSLDFYDGTREGLFADKKDK